MEGNVNYAGEPATNNTTYQDQSANQGTRETGIIEKLLHSYGFIQCTKNLVEIQIAEFEMSYDRRTGKPIASTVSKIAPEVVH